VKIIVEISLEELCTSTERAEANTSRRLSVVEWVARDLAGIIAGNYARSQKVQWALEEIFRPVILAQLTAGEEVPFTPPFRDAKPAVASVG
jgi:hypothetical protein